MRDECIARSKIKYTFLSTSHHNIITTWIIVSEKLKLDR